MNAATQTTEIQTGINYNLITAAQEAPDMATANKIYGEYQEQVRAAYGFATHDRVQIGNGKKAWYVARIDDNRRWGGAVLFTVELVGSARYTGAARPIRRGLTIDQLTAIAA